MSGIGISATVDNKLLGALAKKLYGNGALTLAEQDAVNVALGTGTVSSGFPAAAGGDVEGWNSLSRTNWFNGRFLTAEALRRQDSYADQRARLDAQALAPGIAYGLGIDADGLNASGYQSRMQWGFPADRAITLSPGLAFDQIGRPILVPRAFQFTLAQLVSLQRSKPRRVAPGGTEFAPCVCLVPEPAGPQGGGPAIRPGPYLLVIEAAEKASGSAKVYGDVCGGSQPVTCESDAWTAGFGLSLVRFPVEVQNDDTVRTPWDLRGILSAYYFDVFEHSLIKRWDPPFAADHGFRGPTDPWRHDNGAIALAMVYLADEHTARFVDPWIPRRSIVASPGEESHRVRFGAPPRSAAWARIHQFQAMLGESLAAAPLVQNQQLANLNLFDRGFRHMPPIGFLPIDPSLPRGDNRISGIAALDRYLAVMGPRYGLVSGLVRSAVNQGLSYFARTNILTYATVALHDDDILEDLANVFDKDPVNVDRVTIENLVGRLNAITQGNGFTRIGALLRLILQLGADAFVNRSFEVVKLVVPLQGLQRTHPILGVVEEDATGQLADWGLDAASASITLSARAFAGIAQRADMTMLPRHFVVYVKQRMVILDVLLLVWELVRVATGIVAAPAGANNQLTSVKARRALVQQQPAENRELAAAMLQYPAFEATLRQALPVIAPGLASPTRAKAFGDAVDAQDRKLAATIPDAAERRQTAVDRVTDSFAASYRDFEILQVLGAIQPASATETLVQNIADNPVVLSTVAPAASPTLSDQIAAPPVFTTDAGAQIYAEMRAATDALPVATLDKTLADKVPADMTVGELLARSPSDAQAIVGDKATLDALSAAVKARVTDSADAAENLAKPAPTNAVGAALSTALDAHPDPVAAVDAARVDAGASANATKYLDRAATVARVLGTANPVLTRQILAGKLLGS